MHCLDLREILTVANFSYLCDKIKEKYAFSYNRLYLGSSFCANYFISSDIYKYLFRYCSERNYKVSISIPLLTENNLNQGKEKLNSLLEIGNNIVDEVVINDIGMLRYVADLRNINLVLGRLFLKNARDCRLNLFNNSNAKYSFLPFPASFASIHISGVELDPIAVKIDLSELKGFDGTIALNVPYCFMSFGNICKFASIYKSPCAKFRPSAPCGMECLDIAEIHSDHRHPEQGKYYRIGKAVFFRQNPVEISGLGHPLDRELYFPIEEFLAYLKRQ